MPSSATELLAELPRLRRYARVLTGDSELADRLVEETLFRFRRRSSEAASETARRLQLMALLRTINAEELSSGTRAMSLVATSARPAAWVPEQSGSPRSLPDHAADVVARLGELPLEQREVLVLVAVEQLAYGDIATLLRIPVATVVSRLSQAREALHAAASKPRSAPHNLG